MTHNCYESKLNLQLNNNVDDMNVDNQTVK